MPIRQLGSLEKKPITCFLSSLFTTTTVPLAAMPWTWKTLLARSSPIVVTSCGRSFLGGSDHQRPPYGTSMRVRGGVHLIKGAFVNPNVYGVPFGRRSPRKRGPYSTPINSQKPCSSHLRQTRGLTIRSRSYEDLKIEGSDLLRILPM